MAEGERGGKKKRETETEDKEGTLTLWSMVVSNTNTSFLIVMFPLPSLFVPVQNQLQSVITMRLSVTVLPWRKGRQRSAYPVKIGGDGLPYYVELFNNEAG